jgi:hypothetical protein
MISGRVSCLAQSSRDMRIAKSIAGGPVSPPWGVLILATSVSWPGST